ncbi:hypothetical protein E9423_04120 [Salmonella enterica]|nr:hypothetical protein [Salmonella enterica]EAQ4494879.1 hypothetical protein [Salmonella enterica]
MARFTFYIFFTLNEFIVFIPRFFWRRIFLIFRHMSINITRQTASNNMSAVIATISNDSGALNE